MCWADRFAKHGLPGHLRMNARTHFLESIPRRNNQERGTNKAGAQPNTHSCFVPSSPSVNVANVRLHASSSKARMISTLELRGQGQAMSWRKLEGSHASLSRFKIPFLSISPRDGRFLKPKRFCTKLRPPPASHQPFINRPFAGHPPRIRQPSDRHPPAIR